MSRFANFQQRMNAPLPSDEDDDTDPTRQPGEEDETKPEGKPDGQTEKDTKMSDATITAEQRDKDVADAKAEATKAANDRFNTVLASEEYKGREALASTLLASDLSADKIVEALAAAPKTEAADPAAGKEAAEEAARQTMQEEMRKQGNSGLEDGDDKPADKKAAAAAVWDRANAKIEQRKGN